MLNEQLKKRLKKDREMTVITLRIPVDVVESLKEIAPQRGFAGYQTLLKAYISEGLRIDEAKFSDATLTGLIDALKRHGVSEKVIAEARREMAA